MLEINAARNRSLKPRMETCPLGKRLHLLAGIALLATASYAGAQEAPETEKGTTGIRDLTVLKEALLADVRALERIVAYQEGLLRLADEDPEDALAARRSLQDCIDEITAPALCAVLTSSYANGE